MRTMIPQIFSARGRWQKPRILSFVEALNETNMLKIYCYCPNECWEVSDSSRALCFAQVTFDKLIDVQVSKVDLLLGIISREFPKGQGMTISVKKKPRPKLYRSEVEELKRYFPDVDPEGSLYVVTIVPRKRAIDFPAQRMKYINRGILEVTRIVQEAIAKGVI